MAKLLSSILDKISEENNSYRDILRDLNKDIEEKTSDYVGEIVASTNYILDFSEAVQTANNTIVNAVSRAVESYAIKDLRSVESVNEQFVDKINDKIENTTINSKEDKDNFLSNLNSLLNEKYLEIVKIKRVPFTNVSGVNDDIEAAVSEYSKYVLNSNSASGVELNSLNEKYKSELYNLIDAALAKISSLYLNNFVNEVSSSLVGAVDVDINDLEKDNFKPFEPTFSAVSELPVPDDDIKPIEIENTVNPNEEMLFNKIDELADNNDTSLDDALEAPKLEPAFEIPEDVNVEEPAIEDVKPTLDIPQFDVPAINPVEVNEEPLKEAKRQYDVEEILKIAKSPIVSQESDIGVLYNSVEPIKDAEEADTFTNEFDEKEIVDEMISRLTKRLETLNRRQRSYEDDKEKLSHDENFVNDLIENAKNKKAELDEFEKELDKKEEELNEKQKELNKKLNDVLPFANAFMKQE